MVDGRFHWSVIQGDPDPEHDGYVLKTVGGAPVWLPSSSVPPGGAAHEALVKLSGADYDMDWIAAVLGLTSIDSSVTITDNGDGTFDLAVVGGGGGGGGALLLESSVDPDSDVPGGTAVGTLVFMKAGVAAPTTWDLRGLSGLPSGWARRGVASETFDAAGMSATYAAGQGHYFTLGSPVAAGVLEAKMVTGPTSGVMLGPIIMGAGNVGGCSAWYSGPSGDLILSVNSSHQYGGSFANAGGTPAYPAWFRVRWANIGTSASAYASFSMNGTSWSAEAAIPSAFTAANATELSIGSIFSSASAKFEYVKWSPSSSIAGGLLGWWDGSAIVAF